MSTLDFGPQRGAIAGCYSGAPPREATAARPFLAFIPIVFFAQNTYVCSILVYNRANGFPAGATRS